MSFFDDSTPHIPVSEEANKASAPPSIKMLIPLILNTREVRALGDAVERYSAVIEPALKKYESMDAENRKKLSEALGRLIVFFISRHRSRKAFQRNGMTKQEAKDFEHVTGHVLLRAKTIFRERD